MNSRRRRNARPGKNKGGATAPRETDGRKSPVEKNAGAGLRRPRPVFVAAAGVLLATSLATGVPAIVKEIRIVFRNAPLRMISPELGSVVRSINERMPPQVPLLYFDSKGEYWNSRLWQKAFSPRRVFLLYHDAWGPTWPSADALDRTFSTRWALSAGNPPEDPGFAWHTVLPRIPGSQLETWFGVLR